MLDEKQISIIGKEIINQKMNIATDVENMNAKAKGEATNTSSVSKEKRLQMRAELFGIIGETLVSDNEDEGLKEVYDWGKRVGTVACDQGVPLDKTLLLLPHYRKVIFDFINAEFHNEDMIYKDYSVLSERINPVIDKATFAFSQSYVEHNEKVYNAARDELIELSVPIVPLTKDVAILPLIGTIDTYRSNLLMEKVLKKGVDLGLQYLIIDLSGVHMVDTAVAHNLFHLHDALKLVGITAIISGIRPEIAQTMVDLGICLRDMKVVHSLPSALPLTGLKIDSDH